MARPALPRPLHRQGRRAARRPAPCASFTVGSCSRASSSTLATRSMPRPRGACCRSTRPPKACRSRSSGRSSIRTSTTLLPLVTEYSAGATCSARPACPASPTRSAWSIGRRRSPKRRPGDRGSRSRSSSSSSCSSSAPRRWRANAVAGIALRQQARAHDAAAKGASVRIDRRPDAGHARNFADMVQ